jgi:hypothetical protein
MLGMAGYAGVQVYRGRCDVEPIVVGVTAVTVGPVGATVIGTHIWRGAHNAAKAVSGA